MGGPDAFDREALVAEIRRLAEERRRLLAEGMVTTLPIDGAVPVVDVAAALDLRAPVPVPDGALGRVLAVLDRLRRRALQAILTRQSGVNQAVADSLTLLHVNLRGVQHAQEQANADLLRRLDALSERLARIEKELERR